MLHRFFLIWLILSMLGYGMVLAVDVHDAQIQAPESIAATHEDGQEVNHVGLACCDHCAHGSAHLLGLHAAFDFQIAPVGAPIRGDYRPVLRSPPFQELLKPPALG